jgi:putative oxidoreductase
MMALMGKALICIARALISLIFLYAGASKLMNWQGTVDVLSMTLSNWYTHLGGTLITEQVHEFLLESASLILGVATFLEICGALLLLLGIKVKWGAFMLLVFLIPTTIIFHAFWFEIGADQEKEIGIFLKNLALIGGLLYFLIGSPFERSES